MKTLPVYLLGGLCLVSSASAATVTNLSDLGNLVRFHPSGDSRYPHSTTFISSGVRGYVSTFSKLLSPTGEDTVANRSLMMQGIVSWETEARPKGFANDVAGAFALYTLVNVALAKHEDYKFYLLPNLVAQYRKAFSAKGMSQLGNTKRQALYDYLLAQSVYLETIAASNPSMTQQQIASLRHEAEANVRSTFGVGSEALSLSESGLNFG